jgi:predicted acetyltransferase
MAHAFSGGRVQTPRAPDAPPPTETDLAGQWGLFADGDLRAAYSLVPFQAHWGGQLTLPLGGVAGVATFAEARGQGHVGQLLRHMLGVMRDAGQPLSALYPFAWAFYRRYGWDWVGEKRQVTLPLREVRAAPEGKNVREVRGDEATVRAALAPVYSAFAQNYRGVFDAPTTRWGSRLSHGDNRTTYAYVHQPPGASTPDGYLLWRFDGHNDAGRVREFVAQTPEAHRGLLSLLHYFGTQKDKAEITTLPADHRLWHHVMHWDLETKTSPVFMGRVVDVPAALAALTPDLPNGAATIAVRDEHAPWNEGTWLVTCENGTVTCAPAPHTSVPDLSLDIQAFSQAFWGTPSLATLVGAGRVTARNKNAVAWLDRLLSGPPVFTLDDF